MHALQRQRERERERERERAAWNGLWMLLTHHFRSLNSTSDFQPIMHETTTEARRALCYREPIPEDSIKSALRYPTYILVCRSMGIPGMDRYSYTRGSNLYLVYSVQIPSGKTRSDDNLRCCSWHPTDRFFI